jgi:endoglucanase
MKKAAIFGLILALLAGVGLVLSCEGPAGPVGPAGPAGPLGKDTTSPASANYAVSQMRAGWGMGNTFDANSMDPTAWGNTVVTKAGFQYLKDAGFNVVRIPVSWNGAIPGAPGWGNSWNTTNADYTIDPIALANVKACVQNALDAGMYVIVNTHHDNALFGLTDGTPTFQWGDTTFQSGVPIDQSLIAMEKVWRQIAEALREFPDKLIFEGLNEPRVSGANEWNGGIQEYHRNLNRMHQKFVDTVRETGGNNLTRFLLVCSYAASGTEIAQQGLVAPYDNANPFVNKIIVSLHMYDPYPFALNRDINNAEGYTTYWAENGDTAAAPGATVGYDAGGLPINGPSILKERFAWANDYFIKKGYPVIIGETGAINKYKNNDPDAGFNTDSRVRWAEYYWGHAKSYGMPVIWWDNGRLYMNEDPDQGIAVTGPDATDELGGAIFDRISPKFPGDQQKVVDAIMRATQ